MTPFSRFADRLDPGPAPTPKALISSAHFFPFVLVMTFQEPLESPAFLILATFALAEGTSARISAAMAVQLCSAS